MTKIKKSFLSIIFVMLFVSLLGFATLYNSGTTARADEITASDFTVGISVRIGDELHNTGVRFTVRIEKDKFDTLMTAGELNDGVSTGMLVTSNAIAKNLEDGLVKKYVYDKDDDTTVAGVYDLDTTTRWEISEEAPDYYESSVAIYDVPAASANVNLAIRPYIVYGGETVYKAEPFVKNMADAVLNDTSDNKAALTATYITANEYTVTYYDKSGTAVENGTETKYYGDTIASAKVSAPSETGYTFDAWKNEAGTSTWTFGTTKVTGNVNLYAKYTATEYTATINRANGDTENVTYTIEDRAEKLASISLMENSDEWAYSWSSALPAELPLEDVEFTETRAKKTYQVLWNDYNGNNLETDSAVEYGDTPSYDGDEPTRTGYTFSAWSPAATTVTGAATYVATYTANEYTLSFTGGDSEVDSITATYDSALSSLPEVPERTGYYGVWKIDGTVVSSTDVWNYTTAKTADAVYCNLNNVTYEEAVVYSFEYTNADVEIYDYSTNDITALDVGGDYALKVTCNNVDGVPSVVVPAGRVSARDIWEADIYVSENATILDYTSGNYGLNFKANNISLAAGWNHVTFVAKSTARALIRLNLSKGDVYYVDNLKKIDINQDDITFEEGADIVLTNNANNERIVDSKYGLTFITPSSVNLMNYNDLTISKLPYGVGGGNYLIKYVPLSSGAPSVRLNDRTIGDVYVMWLYIQSDTVSNLNLRNGFQTTQMPNPLPNNTDSNDRWIPTNQWTPILIKISGSSVGFYFENSVVANISAIYIDNIKKIGTLNDGGDITIDFEEGAYGAFISNGFSGSLYKYNDGLITENDNGGDYALKLTGKGYYRITKNLVTDNATWSMDIYVAGAEGTNYTLIENGCTLSTTTIAANTWTTVIITCTPGKTLAGFGLTSGTFSAVYIDNLKTV